VGLSWQVEVLLYVTTFISGFLNATVGGGGMLQIPMMMLALPATPLAMLIGTSKLAGLPGLTGAGIHFTRKLKPEWPLILRAGLAEIPFAILGASVATRLNPAYARPIILAMLAAMTAHVWLQPRFGEAQAGKPKKLTGPVPWVSGALVGLYEGFLGSGSGSILIVLFVTVCGLDLVGASVASAMVTLAGVAAAVVTFLARKSVLIPLALHMAAFNVVGSLLGARVVTLRGNAVLRRMLGIVLLLLIAKLGWDMLRG
jgi:uncharacterized membrane protein YfcA